MGCLGGRGPGLKIVYIFKLSSSPGPQRYISVKQMFIFQPENIFSHEKYLFSHEKNMVLYSLYNMVVKNSWEMRHH